MARVIKVALVITDKGPPGDLVLTGRILTDERGTFDVQKPGVGGSFNVSSSIEISDPSAVVGETRKRTRRKTK